MHENVSRLAEPAPAPARPGMACGWLCRARESRNSREARARAVRCAGGPEAWGTMLGMRTTTTTINSKFGPLEVHVHEPEEGYVATVSARHDLSGLIELDGELAQSREAALAQLNRAVERLPHA
jgi:hypothetical protein